VTPAVTTTRYGSAALDRELADLRQVPEGTRNEALNRTAFSLGRLVAGGELDGPAVEDELLSSATEIGLHPIEARSTIRSGMRAGARQPRGAPEKTPTTQAAELHPDYRLREQLTKLVSDPAWPLEWETAKALAPLPPRLAHQDIASSWDFLSDRVDIPRLLASVNLIRGAATFRYLNAKTVEDPGAIAAAVHRLVWEVEGR